MLDAMVMTLVAPQRRPHGWEPSAGDMPGSRSELLDRVGRGGASVLRRARDRFVAALCARSPTEDSGSRPRAYEVEPALMLGADPEAAAGCGPFQDPEP